MKILYTFLLLNFSICFSQNNKYIIEFKDKNNSPYTISEPSAYLSPAAIERRLRQNIPIEFNDLPPNPNYIQNILNKGVKFLHQSRWFNSVTVSISDNSIIEEIRNLDCVKGIKKAERKILALPYEYSVQSKYLNSNSIKKSSLNLTNDVYDYGQSLAQVNQIGGICMHNQGFDGRNRIICVMDAGFKNADTLSCFDSIRNNGQLLGTWDFVANEASVFEDNDHGAMVLSCMASNMPGVHIGTAPKASYWLLRTENAASELIIEEDNWMTGAEFADSVGADIINSSLGYTLFDSASQNHTWADLDGNTATATKAADIAASKGIIVCNSAGNEGASSWKYISVPADADSILTVGAVDANGVRASFSGRGPTTDGRIKPDVAANGNGTYVIAPWSGGVIQSGGTSFSSPLIAGMTACLWQANPNKTNMEIIQAIKNAGNQSMNPDTLLGWGIPNYCQANATLSGIQNLTFNTNNEYAVVFYNSEEETFNIYFQSLNEKDITIIFSDLTGKILLSESRKVKKNNLHFFKIENTLTLSSGIYTAQIISESSRITKKIFKP